MTLKASGHGKKPPTGGQASDALLGPSRALRGLRVGMGLSLRALSALSGLSYSTLSKLENGKMGLSYDKLIRLSQALNVDLQEILVSSEEHSSPAVIGRRSVARAGQILGANSERHSHLYPASDLIGKKMTPIIIDVQSRSVSELGGLIKHSGEEYVYVLRGSMELHSDLYEPLYLEAGDSVYFDSGMAHAYIRTSEDSCTVLAVCAGLGIRQLGEVAGQRQLGQHASDR